MTESRSRDREILCRPKAERQSLSPSISLTWLAAHCVFFANRRVISRLRVDRCPPACSEQFPEPFPTDPTTALRYSELPPIVPSHLLHVWKNSNSIKKKQFLFVNIIYFKHHSLIQRSCQQNQGLFS